MQTTRKTTRSFPTRCLHSLVRPFKPKLVSSSSKQPGDSQPLTPHAKAKKDCDITERQVEGLYVYDLRAKHAASEPSSSPISNGDGNGNERKEVVRHVYYFAGGGWQQPPSSQHWKFCTELCRALGDQTIVSVVSLPLAPHSPAAKTIPILRRFYDAILHDAAAKGNPKVVIAGDSSGGNLALCVTLSALAESSSALAPAGLLVICPAVEMRQMPDRDEYARTNRCDPVLTIDSHNDEAKTWVAESDATEPWISPINADVSLLAQRNVTLLGVTGGYDILTPDALKFRDQCDRARVTGHWLHWEHQMHCFPLAFMYGLPESTRSKDWIVERLKEI